MPPKKIEGCQRKDGYVLVTVEGKRQYLHRHVMEKHLGRKLCGEENVHHINHNRSDNRLENLKLYTTRAEHTLSEGHKPKRKYNQNDFKFCRGCGEKFYRHQKKYKFKKTLFCSHRCCLKNIKRNPHGEIIATRQPMDE